MSINLLAIELKRFLGSRNPEVICITGKWGVGKTHAWRTYLRQAQVEGSIKLQRYAYVSMFGRNSLDDVRSAIVEGTLDSREIDVMPNFASLKSNLDLLGKKSGRLLPWAGLIPGSTNVIGSINRALFMLTTEQLICIDDLERAGLGLDLKNILGLAATLRDEKSCKIVILTNKDALSSENMRVFQEQIEKVADLVVEFAPSSKEAATLAFNQEKSFHTQLSSDVIALGIVNIRTMKKAETFCLQAVEILSGLDPRITQQAVHSVALATYAKLQPGESPPMELIKSFNSLTSYMIDKDGVEDSLKGHKATLRAYDFTNADELDLEIIAGIERGFFDRDALLEAGRKAEKTLMLNDNDNSFQQAWNMFHDSFDDNENEVLEALYLGILSNFEAISPMNLSSTITLLKEFGRMEEAKSALSSYVERRNEVPSFWDLPNQTFGNQVADPDVRAAFSEKYSKMRIALDPVDILTKIAERSGWNPEDISYLATLTADDFITIFKKRRGKSLRHIIQGCLLFKQMVGADDSMRHIANVVEQALIKIARENPLNKRRMKNYIDIPEDGGGAG